MNVTLNTPAPHKTLKSVTEELRGFWEAYLPPKAHFAAKPCYSKSGELVIRFFESELKAGDLYLELISFEFEFPEPGVRTLHKIPFASDWRTRWKELPGAGGGPTIRVPLTDMAVVKRLDARPRQPEPAPLFQAEAATDGELPDMLYSAMTIRDYYCIIHNLPRSNKPWLNALITEGAALKPQAR
jgi:hypothetical protein